MAKDKTFTEIDVARIICNHLDGDERSRLLKMIQDDSFDCNFTYEEEADEEEKRKIREINHEVDIDVGVWGALVGFFAGALVFYESEKEEDQNNEAIEKQRSLDTIQRNLLIAKGFTDLIPRGRNRASFEQALNDIDQESKVLKPCIFIDEQFNELKQLGENLKVESDKVTDKINTLTEKISSWFD